jgi:YHS domain-containing protein
MKIRDPVCGTKIDLADAVASEDRDGWAFFFCSAGCHDRFRSAPDRFSHATASARAKTVPGNFER